jgi:hypothetical protein
MQRLLQHAAHDRWRRKFKFARFDKLGFNGPSHKKNKGR